MRSFAATFEMASYNSTQLLLFSAYVVNLLFLHQNNTCDDGKSEVEYSLAKAKTILVKVMVPLDEPSNSIRTCHNEVVHPYITSLHVPAPERKSLILRTGVLWA